MTTIRGTIKDRRLELDAPADWPDGTEVEVRSLAQSAKNDDDPMSPEQIAQTLAAMTLVVPLDMTDEELAYWEAERQGDKEREKSQFAIHADELRRMWE